MAMEFPSSSLKRLSEELTSRIEHHNFTPECEGLFKLDDETRKKLK